MIEQLMELYAVKPSPHARLLATSLAGIAESGTCLKRMEMGKSLKKARHVGEGSPCPKCGQTMRRCEHGPEWKPRADQPYYFAYWDKCRPCGHMQHYEAAKVTLIEDPLTQPFKATLAI